MEIAATSATTISQLKRKRLPLLASRITNSDRVLTTPTSCGSGWNLQSRSLWPIFTLRRSSWKQPWLGFALRTLKDPNFCVAFDEVGFIMAGVGNGRFIALHRVISILSQSYNFWFLFASTESNLESLIPLDYPIRSQFRPGQPSTREGRRLQRYAPFTALAVDLRDLISNSRSRPIWKQCPCMGRQCTWPGSAGPCG